jgi:hypothetical protein
MMQLEERKMKLMKQEIEEELVHKNNIIRALRARLRPLEIQAAQKGINTPPEVMTEIGTLTDQIRVQEDEITKLESLAAEGQLSLAEVEYRVILAEAWDTPIGRPTAAGAARLELARLRLGLPPARAREIEKEVRVALVEEIFLEIDISPLLGQDRELPGSIGAVTVEIYANEEGTVNVDRIEISQNLTISNPLESALRLIGKAIRLDPLTALRLLLQSLPREPTLDFTAFQTLLFTENRVWVNRDERIVFDNFLADLTAALNARMLPSP